MIGHVFFSKLPLQVLQSTVPVANCFNGEGGMSRWSNEATDFNKFEFNAKIKAFRAALHSVRDLKFFFFRLAKIYA